MSTLVITRRRSLRILVGFVASLAALFAGASAASATTASARVSCSGVVTVTTTAADFGFVVTEVRQNGVSRGTSLQFPGAAGDVIEVTMVNPNDERREVRTIVVGEPTGCEPATTQPPATLPPTTQPPATEPATTAPPATNPATTSAPTTAPPTTEPGQTLPISTDETDTTAPGTTRVVRPTTTSPQAIDDDLPTTGKGSNIPLAISGALLVVGLALLFLRVRVTNSAFRRLR